MTTANTAKPENKSVLFSMWRTPYKGFGCIITDEVFDRLQTIEKGGYLVIREMEEVDRKKENSPHAYVKFITAAEMAASKARKAKETPKVAAVPDEI